MKRKFKPRPTPGRTFATDVPRVRDAVVDDCLRIAGEILSERERADRLNADLVRITGRGVDVDEASAWHRALAAGFASADCHLWWVTEPMTRLAYAATDSMPEWTPAAARPSRHGVVLWDGGIGVDYDWQADPLAAWRALGCWLSCARRVPACSSCPESQANPG